MHQLVYMSRATRGLSIEELQALCVKARSVNAGSGVTGLLLYDGARFIQALEGPRDQVELTMRRIAADPRHSEIAIMTNNAVSDRQFGNWSMDYQAAPSGCCSQEFLERVKTDVSVVADDSLKAAFIGFALLGERASTGYRCTAG